VLVLGTRHSALGPTRRAGKLSHGLPRWKPCRLSPVASCAPSPVAFLPLPPPLPCRPKRKPTAECPPPVAFRQSPVVNTPPGKRPNSSSAWPTSRRSQVGPFQPAGDSELSSRRPRAGTDGRSRTSDSQAEQMPVSICITIAYVYATNRGFVARAHTPQA
jgi:hypothetical protein